VGDDTTRYERSSAAQVVPPLQPRKLAKVPFVELADGRLQGVVSSGSDPDRVYVSSITAGNHAYNCSTNNNRPCGGLGGAPCNHLRVLVQEAVLQYSLSRVARYLRVEVGEDGDVLGSIKGRHESTSAATVFSSFLRHLSYLELPGTTDPIPELHWFPATGGAR
jgi:hypothetical protein